jgi:hypothetical protein
MVILYEAFPGQRGRCWDCCCWWLAGANHWASLGGTWCRNTAGAPCFISPCTTQYSGAAGPDAQILPAVDACGLLCGHLGGIVAPGSDTGTTARLGLDHIRSLLP